jgi:hypothetical protein
MRCLDLALAIRHARQARRRSTTLSRLARWLHSAHYLDAPLSVANVPVFSAKLTPGSSIGIGAVSVGKMS